MRPAHTKLVNVHSYILLSRDHYTHSKDNVVSEITSANELCEHYASQYNRFYDGSDNKAFLVLLFPSALSVKCYKNTSAGCSLAWLTTSAYFQKRYIPIFLHRKNEIKAVITFSVSLIIIPTVKKNHCQILFIKHIVVIKNVLNRKILLFCLEKLSICQFPQASKGIQIQYVASKNKHIHWYLFDTDESVCKV